MAVPTAVAALYTGTPRLACNGTATLVCNGTATLVYNGTPRLVYNGTPTLACVAVFAAAKFSLAEFK
jgi:hypothetical protein